MHSLLTIIFGTAAGTAAPTETIFDAKFWNDFFITVTDKGILALALVAVGFLINKAIERFKSEQALRSGLAQRTLDNIGEVWQKISEWEAHIDAVLADYLRKRSDAAKSELSQVEGEFGNDLVALQNESDGIRRVARTDRFWTGEEPFCSFTEYCEKICRELSSIKPNDVESVSRVQQALKTGRLDAARMLDRILQRPHWLRRFFGGFSPRANDESRQPVVNAEAKPQPPVERVGSRLQGG